MDIQNSDVPAVEDRALNFWGDVKSLVACMDGMCLNDRVWKKPVHTYTVVPNFIIYKPFVEFILEMKPVSKLADVSYWKGI